MVFIPDTKTSRIHGGYFYLFANYGQHAADVYTTGVLCAIIVSYCADWIRRLILSLVDQAHDEKTVEKRARGGDARVDQDPRS